MPYWMGVAALVQGLGLLHENPGNVWWHIALVGTKSMEPNHRLLRFGWGSHGQITSSNMKELQSKCHTDVTLKKQAKLRTHGKANMFIELNETTSTEHVAMLNHVMDALTPKREQQCTLEQTEQLRIADSNFENCVGVSNNIGITVAASLFETFRKKCHSSDTMIAGTCMNAILANQVLADMLRHLYRNTGKYCDCTKALQNELPSCSITLGDMIDKRVKEQTLESIDVAYRDIKISLGFVKQYFCGVGLVCDVLEGTCADQLQWLDECLNDSVGCGENRSPACTSNLFLSLPSELTRGMMPDVCLHVYDNNRFHTGVVENFADYIESCHPQAFATTTMHSDRTPADFQIVNARWIDEMVFLGILSVTFISVIVLVVDQIDKQRNLFGDAGTHDNSDQLLMLCYHNEWKQTLVVRS